MTQLEFTKSFRIGFWVGEGSNSCVNYTDNFVILTYRSEVFTFVMITEVRSCNSQNCTSDEALEACESAEEWPQRYSKLYRAMYQYGSSPRLAHLVQLSKKSQLQCFRRSRRPEG